MNIIRASEIHEYLFCSRAWWLRRVANMQPEGQERRRRGTMLHVQHGRMVKMSMFLLVLAGVFLVAAIMALVVVS